MNLDALAKENILDQIDKIHKVDLPDNLVQQELVSNIPRIKKRRC